MSGLESEQLSKQFTWDDADECQILNTVPRFPKEDLRELLTASINFCDGLFLFLPVAPKTTVFFAVIFIGHIVLSFALCCQRSGFVVGIRGVVYSHAYQFTMMAVGQIVVISIGLSKLDKVSDLWHQNWQWGRIQVSSKCFSDSPFCHVAVIFNNYPYVQGQMFFLLLFAARYQL